MCCPTNARRAAGRGRTASPSACSAWPTRRWASRATGRARWRSHPPRARWRNERLPAGPRYIGLATGSREVRKNWPVERYIALAQALEASGRTPVFLIGPQERELLEKLRAAVPSALFPEATPPDPALGLARLEFAIALCHRLSAAVANDSGIGHLLGAIGTPLVTLFGPTDAARWAPFTTGAASSCGRRSSAAIRWMRSRSSRCCARSIEADQAIKLSRRPGTTSLRGSRSRAGCRSCAWRRRAGRWCGRRCAPARRTAARNPCCARSRGCRPRSARASR